MSLQAHEHSKGHEAHIPAIHFKVDGEPYDTRALELTANEILKDFAGVDPATHYLLQIHGHHHISFLGKGDDPIRMEEGMRFQVISTGPTPVSNW